MDKSFMKLVEIVKKLRAPDGCPWDREQDLFSLKNQVVEEVHELVDALDNKDYPNIKEELGDVLLHVVFHSIIAEEDNIFNLTDVIEEICEKLVRRHPHVFGNISVKDSDEVISNWEKIKKEEKKRDSSILSNIPNGMPSLLKSRKFQEKVKKVGFDWSCVEDCMLKLNEEFAEFKEAVSLDIKENIEHELGDLLFSIVNVSRFVDVDADEALRKANSRFKKRFEHIENTLANKGVSFADAGFEEMDRLWNEAKSIEKMGNRS